MQTPLSRKVSELSSSEQLEYKIVKPLTNNANAFTNLYLHQARVNTLFVP
jgi:hypothetical protein